MVEAFLFARKGKSETDWKFFVSEFESIKKIRHASGDVVKKLLKEIELFKNWKHCKNKWHVTWTEPTSETTSFKTD